MNLEAQALRIAFVAGLRALEANPARLVHCDGAFRVGATREVRPDAGPGFDLARSEFARTAALARRLGLGYEAALIRCLRVGFEETAQLSNAGRLDELGRLKDEALAASVTDED